MRKLLSSHMTLTALLLTIAVATVSCRPTLEDQTSAAAPADTRTAVPSPLPTRMPTLTPRDTSVVVEPLSSSTPEPTLPTDLPSSPPVFVIDTPTITTTSDVIWRPPAYSIPWAPSLYDHFYFSPPIAARDVKLPLSDYRYGNIFFGDHVHTGIDISAELNKPVYAAGEGRVIWSGYGLYLGGYREDDPYGISVVIKHSYGYRGMPLYTVYAHLAETLTEEGAIVQAGDVIGTIGETGHTTGPHLHFEVRVGANDFYSTYNPLLWTAPPRGWGILVGRIESTYGQLLKDQAVFVHSKTDGEIEEEEEDQVWRGKTYYNTHDINVDPYYRENFVLGNLPAGTYQINIPYIWKTFSQVIEIKPGQVTYFSFQGFNGFTLGELPEPDISFTPAP